jgi:Leucine-rich repeat (LRR) protein
MLLLLLFLLLSLPAISPAKLCHPNDKIALLKISYSFSNPILLPGYSSWNTSTFDCCNIFQCDETTNRVMDVSLTNNLLSGTISEAFSGLTFLQTLRLRHMPFLTGDIPSAIGQLKHLRYLDISYTNISGKIPPILSTLSELMFLYLSFNNLTGYIPHSLSRLPKIIGIDLSRNHLTGNIPNSFGHFLSPVALLLSHNKLSGEIPESLANTMFSRIDLSRNNFTGDALMFFGQEKTSDTIILSRNNFEFNLSGVSFMKTLVTLDISHNKIYGSIPLQITEDYMMQFFNVSYNRLCGEIPTRWNLRYRSEGFDYSSYFHNNCLCGPPLDMCH